MVASVLRSYPAYRISDFYQKSFKEGGLTYGQLIFLFLSADEDKYRDFKFYASLQGVDLDNPQGGQEAPAVNVPKEQAQFMFRDPAEYEAMDPEQRRAEHDKMVGHWSGFELRNSPTRENPDHGVK